MKILILSCNTGEGHHSAAKAIAEAAEKRGIEWELANPIAFKNERARKIVDASYNNMIKKTPKLFGAVYRLGTMYDRTSLTSPVYYTTSLCAKPLNDYIRAKGFDAVICTHLFGMEAMTAIRRRKMNDIPVYGVMTDYTSIPFFGETELDGYIIPHGELAAETADKGVPADKIYPFGIPVAGKFSNRIGRDAARELLKAPKDRRVYLIMSGGVGCGGISDLCDELIRADDGEYLACVMAGKNEKMTEQLSKRFANEPCIRIVPFTKEVNVYMEAADVMISKPGGLSSTEAAVSGIPIVHLMTIPGCETKNAEFFRSHGMSVLAEDIKDAAEKAKRFTFDSDAADEMRRCQAANTNPRAADAILDLVMKNE